VVVEGGKKGKGDGEMGFLMFIMKEWGEKGVIIIIITIIWEEQQGGFTEERQNKKEKPSQRDNYFF
jgi:hypothetical protein